MLIHKSHIAIGIIRVCTNTYTQNRLFFNQNIVDFIDSIVCSFPDHVSNDISFSAKYTFPPTVMHILYIERWTVNVTQNLIDSMKAQTFSCHDLSAATQWKCNNTDKSLSMNLSIKVNETLRLEHLLSSPLTTVMGAIVKWILSAR